MIQENIERQETNYDYIKTSFRELPAKRKQNWAIFLGVLIALYPLGMYYAYHYVPGVAGMAMSGRLLGTVMMGPMGALWWPLEFLGVLQEDPQNPGLAWLVLSALHIGLLYGGYLYLAAPVNEEQQLAREKKRKLRQQGHLEPDEAAEILRCSQGVPMATVKTSKKAVVEIGHAAAEQGHVLVCGSTRSGKGLHLSRTLLTWAPAAIIVDPKGEQYERLARVRGAGIEPLYRIPGHSVDLAALYDLTDKDSIRELHAHLMRPDEDGQSIFAEKSLSLFEAAGHYAAAKGLNPLRVLLDAAEDDFVKVLQAFDSVPAARQAARKFTNNLPPELFNQDRFVSSAYGTFVTRLYDYQKHIETICPTDRSNVIPANWAEKRATIFITYDLTELKAVGGLVSAILAGLMRAQMRAQMHTLFPTPVLFAIDELPALRLKNLETYLATVGGYNMTVLMYIQALSQLEEVYGRHGVESILANTANQVWYPPNDITTAKKISELCGTTYRKRKSFSRGQRYNSGQNGRQGGSRNTGYSETVVEEPILTPAEIMAMKKDKVIAIIQRNGLYRVMGERLNPLAQLKKLAHLPMPNIPQVSSKPRVFTPWLGEEKPEPPQAPADDAGAEGDSGPETDSPPSSLGPKKPLK